MASRPPPPPPPPRPAGSDTPAAAAPSAQAAPTAALGDLSLGSSAAPVPAATAAPASVPPPIPARPPAIPPRPAVPPPLPSSATAAPAAASAEAAASSEQGASGASSPAYVPPAKASVNELLQKDADDSSLAMYKASLLSSATSAKYPSDPRLVILERVQLLPDEHAAFDLALDAEGAKKPFVLKEGASFHLMLHFVVQHQIVSGLRVSTNVKRLGLKVDSSEEMMGSYAPSDKVLTFRLAEECTPSGFLARGTYVAHGRLTDDDEQLHAEFEYTFQIKSSWS